jgi:hypothetical protein
MGRITEKLLDKHRDINVQDTWWDSVYEDWVAKLIDLGMNLTASDIQFSGFWSQGDGASFECRLVLDTFLEKHGLAEKYPAVMYWAKQEQLTARMTRFTRSHSHQYCVHFESEESIYIDGQALEEGDLREAVAEAMYEKLSTEMDGLEEDVNDTCRGYMQEIYSALEEEYEHLTSDEVITEYLEENEIFDDEDDDEEHNEDEIVALEE